MIERYCKKKLVFARPLLPLGTDREVHPQTTHLALVTKNKKVKENIETQITTLQSYRKSLIHECVTGKKQVWEGGN